MDLVDRLIIRGLGSDLETLSENDDSCLDIACMNDDLAMVAILIKNNVEICVNSLNQACRFGSVELVRLLKCHASEEGNHEYFLRHCE